MINEPIARRYHFGECSLSHFSQIFTVMSKNHQETCETFMTMMMMMMMMSFIPFVPGFQDVSSLFCGNSLFSEVCVAGCPCIVHLGGSRGWEELREALKSRGTSAVSSIWMLWQLWNCEVLWLKSRDYYISLLRWCLALSRVNKL